MKWWGYIHKSGSLQVKRFFDKRDLEEAYESPFVEWVFGPWECEDRNEALEKLRNATAYKW